MNKKWVGTAIMGLGIVMTAASCGQPVQTASSGAIPPVDGTGGYSVQQHGGGMGDDDSFVTFRARPARACGAEYMRCIRAGSSFIRMGYFFPLRVRAQCRARFNACRSELGLSPYTPRY